MKKVNVARTVLAGAVYVALVACDGMDADLARQLSEYSPEDVEALAEAARILEESGVDVSQLQSSGVTTSGGSSSSQSASSSSQSGYYVPPGGIFDNLDDLLAGDKTVHAGEVAYNPLSHTVTHSNQRPYDLPVEWSGQIARVVSVGDHGAVLVGENAGSEVYFSVVNHSALLEGAYKNWVVAAGCTGLSPNEVKYYKDPDGESTGEIPLVMNCFFGSYDALFSYNGRNIPVEPRPLRASSSVSGRHQRDGSANYVDLRYEDGFASLSRDISLIVNLGSCSLTAGHVRIATDTHDWVRVYPYSVQHFYAGDQRENKIHTFESHCGTIAIARDNTFDTQEYHFISFEGGRVRFETRMVSLEVVKSLMR